MKFDNIFISSVTAAFELINDDCYHSSVPYDVYLNNKQVYQNQKTNVFSLYDLFPDTEYKITVIMKDITTTSSFKTLSESAFIDIKKFGALGDGIHDDTLAIQTAIMAVPKNGRIVFNQGTYLTKPIFLRDDLTIEFKKGAILLADPNRLHYSILPGLIDSTDEKSEYHLNSWEGNPLDTFTSIITGINVSNVKIIGEGIINGNADNSDWWINPKVKNISWRPRLFFMNRCNDISLHGVTITNSPAWNIHPFYSNNINIIDITIKNPMDSPNTDGINPESCNNVNIIGTKISVGDDCVVLKAGKLYLGTYYQKPIENVTIRNCFMENGHGAVVLGSEISSGAKNIHVSKCKFLNTDRGLRIKTRRGRGENSIIDFIHFDNILMDGVKTPFTMNMFYRCDPDGDSSYVQTNEPLPVDKWTPHLGSFTFSNIHCQNVKYAAVYCVGLPEQKIHSITLKNVSFDYSKDLEKGNPIMRTVIDEFNRLGAYFSNVNSVFFDNVTFNGQIGEETVLDNVDEMKRVDLG